MKFFFVDYLALFQSTNNIMTDDSDKVNSDKANIFRGFKNVGNPVPVTATTNNQNQSNVSPLFIFFLTKFKGLSVGE